MIWTIARKEIHENLISPRFLLLFLLAIVFIPSSLYTNYRAYLRRVSEQQQIEQRNREFLRGLQPMTVFTNAGLSFDVYWPPAPASVFASGFEEEHPRHLVISRYSVEYGAPLDVKQPAGIFGTIDYLFVVQFIFSLFAVLLSFDAITREKESGTLRSMLSNSLSRAVLASGKLIGGYITLALPLVIAFLAGLLVLAAAGLDVFAGDFLARAGWVLSSSLLYIAVFFLLGLLVSSMANSTYAALVVSLAFWLIAVLVAPRAASLAAQVLRPVQSRHSAWLEKLAAVAALEKEKGRALDELIRRLGQPGDDWRKQREPIANAFEERTAQALQRVEELYRQRKAEQRRVGLALARLSPAGAFVNFGAEVAGTGSTVEARFLIEAERYREVVTRELFSRVYRDVTENRVQMGTLKPIKPSALPEFRMTRPSVAESFFGADLAILLGWFAAAAGAIYWALARYDVR